MLSIYVMNVETKNWCKKKPNRILVKWREIEKKKRDHAKISYSNISILDICKYNIKKGLIDVILQILNKFWRMQICLPQKLSALNSIFRFYAISSQTYNNPFFFATIIIFDIHNIWPTSFPQLMILKTQESPLNLFELQLL